MKTRDEYEPRTWVESLAEDQAHRAEGLVPCEGWTCPEWLLPDQVVVQDGDRAYGPCCALLGVVVDADVIADVCQTLLRRGTVIGRRVSVTAHNLTMREGAPDWALVYKNGAVIYLAHDLFEAARRYCYIESGKWDLDLDEPVELHPSDAEIERRNFEERTWNIAPRRNT